MLRVLALVVCGMLVAGGCGRTRNTPGGGSATTPITSPGTYRMTGAGQLVVRVDSAGIVRFKVIAPDGRTLTEPDDRPSAYSRWILCSDDRDRVWLYSGDIGTFVWIPSGGTYERQLVNDTKLVAEVPEPLFQALPESLRAQWKAARTPP